VAGCDHPSSAKAGESLEERAEAFGDAWYNWRYADVVKLVTPESVNRVKMVASNVTQEDLDALNDYDDDADVSIDGIQMEDDTVAIVRFDVDEYMSPKHFGEPPVLVENLQQEVRFVRRAGKWLADLI
jgi:hypothetical protein